MKRQTSIGRIHRDYPVCDLFNGYDGYDDGIEPDYDEELDLPDWERVDLPDWERVD